MRMPVLDGYEATKRIKNEMLKRKNGKGEEQTAIIALTASSFEEERAVVLRAGCDDHLGKPFREAELFNLMSTHIGVRFVHEVEGPSIDGQPPRAEDVLTPEALGAVPAKWLATLEQAAQEVNSALLLESVEHIREHDAAVADALSRLINDFRYEEIVRHVQEAQFGKDAR